VAFCSGGCVAPNIPTICSRPGMLSVHLYPYYSLKYALEISLLNNMIFRFDVVLNVYPHIYGASKNFKCCSRGLMVFISPLSLLLYQQIH
jgi:hypothetical protein